MRQLEVRARSIMIAFRPFGRRGSYSTISQTAEAKQGGAAAATRAEEEDWAAFTVKVSCN